MDAEAAGEEGEEDDDDPVPAQAYNDDVVPDYEAERETYADDTYAPPHVVEMVLPDGFVAQPPPDKMPSHRELLARFVMWLVETSADGGPAWIRSVVAGGPKDPSSRARGVTMSLKCTARLDRKTPRELLLFREHIEVA